MIDRKTKQGLSTEDSERAGDCNGSDSGRQVLAELRRELGYTPIAETGHRSRRHRYLARAFSSAAVVVFCGGLVCLSCLPAVPAGTSSYIRMPVNAALVHLTADQKEVLEKRGVPKSVWDGPWATTLWVYCKGNTSTYWVEFDVNGNMFDEGTRGRIHPCAHTKALECTP